MNVFDIFAKIGLDTSEYDNGLDEASKKTSSFASKIGNGLKTAAKVGVAAVGAASAGIVALTKSAVEGYADYEQLVGGIETLFKDSANTVMQYANNAYKTAGLSANQYMETVTSFSASLLQSLDGDTEKSAKYADMAISDMSDNANKMGSSMESIQTAYQGFAKQNYTMLDNLKLGYGGTKSEMERLVEDAEKLNSSFKAQRDESGNLALAYSDIIDAIHIVQDNMDITGTTAKEASQTISGSLASMKAAWENLVTGFANPDADLGLLIDKMVDSGVTAFDNLLPAFEKTLVGISKGIQKLGPIITKKLPGFIKEVVPQVVKSGADFVAALGQGILESAPELLSTTIDLVMQFGQYLADSSDELLEGAVVLIETLADFLVEQLPTLIPVVVDIILTITDKLTDPDMIVKLVDAALLIILALADGIIAALPKLLEKAPVIIGHLITALILALPKVADAGLQLIEKLWEGITNAYWMIVEAGGDLAIKLIEGIADLWEDIKNTGKKIGQKIKDGVIEFVEAAKQWGADMIQNFIDGIISKWNDLKKSVSDIAGSIADYLGFSEPEKGPLSNFHTYAPDMMQLFSKGIEDNKNLITDAINDSFNIEPVIETAYRSNVGGGTIGSNSGLVSAFITALRAVAPEFATNIRIEGNRDRIVDIILDENSKSINASGRGFLEA